MRKLLPLLLIPSILLAYDFSDDFDSYTAGVDLDTTPYWYRYDPCGNFMLADDGGDNIVQTDWNGYDIIAYACFGSAVWSNGSVGGEVSFTGSEAAFGFIARVDGSTGEGYAGGIYPAFPPIGATFIAYIDDTGDYTILTQDYYYPMNEGSTYNVEFIVSDESPVSLEVKINGSTNSSVDDGTYDLATGLSGMFAFYESSEPTFTIDDFFVDDTDDEQSAVVNSSFGEIKAAFH